MSMTRFALVLAALMLVPVACDLPKSKPFGENGAAAGSPAALGAGGNAGADESRTVGQGGRTHTGGSSAGVMAGTESRDVVGGSAGAYVSVGTGGMGQTGSAVDAGAVPGAAGRLGAAGTVATGGTMGPGGIPGAGGDDGRDAGPDGNVDAGISPAQAGTAGVGLDAGAAGGGPPANTGTLVLGNLLPMAEIGEFPRTMALGDLNGDGKLDVVTVGTYFSPESVSVLLGRGDGTYGPKTEFEVDYEPHQVALGDLNADGKLDVLAVCYYGSNDVPNVVDVLLGNGDGTLAAKQAYTTADGPQALALGDLDADGHVDVVTADQWADQVSVFRDTGDGTLSTRRDYATAGGPSALALGDVNQDGTLDLVVAATGTGYTQASSLSVLLGNGDGTFGDRADFPFDAPAICLNSSVVLGDLNGDDELDVVVGPSWCDPSNPASARVLLGNGDGSFMAPASLPDVGSPTSVRLLDVNGDGELDLLFALDAQVSVLFGEGNGTFPSRVDYPTGDRLQTLDPGDLNGDGEPDLALTFDNSWGRGGLGVLLGTGGGEFASPLSLPTAEYPASLAAGDVDGDGKLDIAVANSAAGSVSVLVGKGDGTFAARKDYATGEQPTVVALGDVDGDGRTDLVALDSAAETVNVLLGTAQGTLAGKLDTPTAGRPASAALGDVNGDAQLDIVTTNGASVSSEKGTVNVLLGTGHGEFDGPVGSPVGVEPTSLALGDLNRDGKLDVVVANQGFGDIAMPSVGVLLGNGDGTFAATADADTHGATSVALTDLNGDRKLDLIVAPYSGPELVVMPGNGDGTFASGLGCPTWDKVRSLVIGDMNGDGKLDVVAASTAVDVLLGNGDGTLAPRVGYAVDTGDLALGDFDGDGRLDIAGATRPASVSVLLNSRR
jgi:hypothetical protein